MIDPQEGTIRVGDHVTATESHWRYPANGEPAPRGVGLCLLTIGRVMVMGEWRDDGGYIAWAPKIKRDKELESKLGLL